MSINQSKACRNCRFVTAVKHVNLLLVVFRCLLQLTFIGWFDILPAELHPVVVHLRHRLIPHRDLHVVQQPVDESFNSPPYVRHWLLRSNSHRVYRVAVLVHLLIHNLLGHLYFLLVFLRISFWDSVLVYSDQSYLLFILWQPTTCRAAPVETHASLQCFGEFGFVNSLHFTSKIFARCFAIVDSYLFSVRIDFT